MSFNLGRPEEVSILDLANRIASLTKTSVIHGEGYPGDSLRRLPDVASCQNLAWRHLRVLMRGSNLCLTLFNNMMPFRRSRSNSVHPMLAKDLQSFHGWFVECAIN